MIFQTDKQNKTFIVISYPLEFMFSTTFIFWFLLAVCCLIQTVYNCRYLGSISHTKCSWASFKRFMSCINMRCQGTAMSRYTTPKMFPTCTYSDWKLNFRSFLPHPISYPSCSIKWCYRWNGNHTPSLWVFSITTNCCWIH